MSGILTRKILGLGRDEDGAALVITLALFMFLYGMCAGVFAIGQSVKDRIHLQNACDAAAYSAAVVQADTISRIATLNRAMSWTYVSMTRRQMDCIVYRWLEHSLVHHRIDEGTAREWYSGSCHGGHYVGPLILNGHSIDPHYIQSRGTLQTYLGWFSNVHLNKAGNVESCYAQTIPLNIDKLQAQIAVDKKTIAEMNKAELRLIDGGDGYVALVDRMRSAAREVLALNLHDTDDYRVFISDKGVGGFDTDQCFKKDGKYLTLSNTEIDETRFLGWIGKGSPRSEFRSGTDVWFGRDGGLGLHRKYLTGITANPLYATWNWWTWRCLGIHDLEGKPKVKDYRAVHPEHKDCDHVYRRCWCESSTYYPEWWYKDGNVRKGPFKWMPYTVTPPSPLSYSAISYADTIYNAAYFEGERAYPIILSSKYFGAAGTFTVGVAKYNENPWTSVFRRVAGYMVKGDASHGIYGLFNPYRYIEWTWAVSSAKAGYLKKSDDPSAKAYRVNWDDRDISWNLCVSDWDAVFVPVRRAQSYASNLPSAGDGGSWAGSCGFLSEWFEGDWQPLESGASVPTYNIAGNMPDLPLMHDGGGSYRNLDWSRLADLMFH